MPPQWMMVVRSWANRVLCLRLFFNIIILYYFLLFLGASSPIHFIIHFIYSYDRAPFGIAYCTLRGWINETRPNAILHYLWRTN